MSAPASQDAHAEDAVELPLKIGSAEDFLHVRSFLQKNQFDEPTLCRVLKLSEMCDLVRVNAAEVQISLAESPILIALSRILLMMQTMPLQEVEALIPGEVFQSFQALDLLRVRSETGEEGSETKIVSSPVWMYPAQGLWIASDKSKDLKDAVFPALSPLTFGFLKHISRKPADQVLDLCSGTGIAALLLSRQAQHAVASDISTRAIHFARFNRLLNDCDNTEVIESNFYSALSGRTFDRIVAHPPYVPSVSNEIVWRDGGQTGEEPLHQIIEGLPEFLRCGGAFFASCAGFDTKEDSFEKRVRMWLGDAQRQFDVIFALHRDISPRELALEVSEVSHDFESSHVLRLQESFSGIGAQRHLKGMLVLQRRKEASATQAITLRTKLSRLSDGASFEWMLDWRHWLERSEAEQELPLVKPRLSSQLRVKVTHVVEDGLLVPADFVLASGRPFLAETRVEPQMIQVLTECDGTRTVLQLFETAREARLLPEGFSLDGFLDFAKKMIERGYLEIEEVS